MGPTKTSTQVIFKSDLLLGLLARVVRRVARPRSFGQHQFCFCNCQHQLYFCNWKIYLKSPLSKSISSQHQTYLELERKKWISPEPTLLWELYVSAPLCASSWFRWSNWYRVTRLLSSSWFSNCNIGSGPELWWRFGSKTQKGNANKRQVDLLYS